MEKRQYLIQLKVTVSSSFAKSLASPAQVDRRRDVICCEGWSWFCNCNYSILSMRRLRGWTVYPLLQIFVEGGRRVKESLTKWEKSYRTSEMKRIIIISYSPLLVSHNFVYIRKYPGSFNTPHWPGTNLSTGTDFCFLVRKLILIYSVL